MQLPYAPIDHRFYLRFDQDLSPMLRPILGLILAVSVLVCHRFCFNLYAEENSSNKFMGTATCASSNCHGSVAPRKGSNILHNEYVTWQKHDKHAKAWVNLASPAGKKMGENLGIENPEEDPLCLNCHATFVEMNLRGEKFDIKDGVGCEACHGGAEVYLSTHTAKGTSHAENLENGMNDLTSPAKRATVCLNCHYGNEKQSVTHRIYGAGHPRISFELDTFSMIQPRHWEPDDDYTKRKGPYDSIKTWLTGQIAGASATLQAILNEKRAGPFPEFSLFYCYSCHHSLAENQWRERDYGGKPGEPRLNLASLVVVKESLSALNSPLGKSLSEDLQALHELYKKGEHRDAVSRMLKSLREAAPFIATQSIGDIESLALLKALVNWCATNSGPQYEVAEQFAMGISAVVATRNGGYQKEIDNMYSSLKDPAHFKPQGFSAACQALKEKL